MSTTVYLTANVTVASVTVVAGGVLSCDRRAKFPITLTTARIVVESGGCFSCTGSGGGDGSSSSSSPTCSITTPINPYTGPVFTVKLASSRPPGSADDDVRTLLVKNGGALMLAGGGRGGVDAVASASTSTSTSNPLITRLAEHATAGSTTIVVSDPDSSIASTWRKGDQIAVAPTDYNPDQTEYFGLVAVTAPGQSSSASPIAILQLDSPLKYARTGRAYGLVHPTSQKPPNQTFVLDARAEIALLTRNIVIQGTPDDFTGLQGDVKVTGGSDVRVYISNVALIDLGRRGQMGRYPLHFHGVGSGGANVVVRHSVVHRSSQRGIVVHCTSGATFANNVVADVQGFAFMLEDGAEENNVFADNLAIDVRAPGDAIKNGAALVTERDNVAGYWFLNAANTFVGNVAAGVQGSGFVLDLDPKLLARPATYTLCPEQVPGFDVRLLSQGTQRSAALLGASVYRALAAKTFVRFENNVVHAAHTGLWMSSLPQQQQPLDSSVRIESFTAWKIATRSAGASKVAFDACVRLSGVQGLRLNRLACANSALSYWSTESGVVTNTLLAWLTDGGGGSGGRGNSGGSASRSPPAAPQQPPSSPQLIPSGAAWQPQWGSRHGGLQSYLSSQAFAGTYAYGSFPPGALSTDFSVSASGALTGAHNLVDGFRRDADAVASGVASPVLALDARMQHAFTDVTGELLGGGGNAATAVIASTAGMRALCNCASCGTAQVDPLIAVYAGLGQCWVVVPGGGGGAGGISSNDDNINSTATTTPAITCAGAASSLLCRPSFVTVEVRGVARGGITGQPTQQQQQLLRVEAPANHVSQTGGPSLAAASSATWSRTLKPNSNVAGTSTWRFLAPMTAAAADELAGGYRFRSSLGGGDWGAADLGSLVVVVGHTTEPRAGLTLVVSRVPEGAVVFADAYPWRDTAPARGGSGGGGGASTSTTPTETATTGLRIDPILTGGSLPNSAQPAAAPGSSSCLPLLRSACPPAPAPCVCQDALGGSDRGFKDVYVRVRTWGEKDASILDTRGQSYLFKLAKYQVRIQLSPTPQGSSSAAAAATAAAAAAPPEDLFASVNTELRNVPYGR